MRPYKWLNKATCKVFLFVQITFVLYNVLYWTSFCSNELYAYLLRDAAKVYYSGSDGQLRQLTFLK
jgi:hypothetical protein